MVATVELLMEVSKQTLSLLNLCGDPFSWIGFNRFRGSFPLNHMKLQDMFEQIKAKRRSWFKLCQSTCSMNTARRCAQAKCMEYASRTVASVQRNSLLLQLFVFVEGEDGRNSQCHLQTHWEHYCCSYAASTPNLSSSSLAYKAHN